MDDKELKEIIDNLDGDSCHVSVRKYVNSYSERTIEIEFLDGPFRGKMVTGEVAER